MPYEMGAQEGGLVDSRHVIDPRLAAKEQEERLARAVAAVANQKRPLNRSEQVIVRQIRLEQAKHLRDQAAWQRKAEAHRQKINELLQKLENSRNGIKEPTFFQKMLGRPRVPGQARREAAAKEESRRRAGKVIRRPAGRKRLLRR